MHGWTLRHRGHLLEVVAAADGRRQHLRFEVDGRLVAERSGPTAGRAFVLDDLDTGVDLPALGLAGGSVAVLAVRPGRLQRCALVLPPTAPGPGDGPGRPERIPFEPPAGTWAHRTYRWQRAHPKLYAARHVAVAVAEVALGLLALRLAVDLIPWGAIPWPGPPDVDLPDVSLPEVPWPDLPRPDLPDWTLPGWVRAVLESKKYWFPILVAAFVALGEVERRRRRQQAEDDAAAKARQDHDEDDGAR
jgi:hypothetical protein